MTAKVKPKPKTSRSHQTRRSIPAGAARDANAVARPNTQRLGSFYAAGPVVGLGRAVQAKVAIDQANDPYEREADGAANRVVAGQSVPVISRLPAGGLSSGAQRQSGEEEPVQETAVQRQAEEEQSVQAMAVQRQEEEPVQEAAIQRQEEEEAQPKHVQRQEEEEPVQELRVQRQEDEEPVQEAAVQRQANEEEPVQSKSAGSASRDDTTSMQLAATDAIHSNAAGEPLTPTTRQTLESSLGADLSEVRVHSDGRAHEAASALHARAFTHKNQIWLGRGASQHDTHLMAHEATHVVQQQAAPRKGAGAGGSLQRTPAGGPAMVQRSLWSDISGVAGAVWDATGGQLVDAAGRVVEIGADFFWQMLERLAPMLVPFLRQIASKGIVGFLLEKIKGAVSGIFRMLNVDSSFLETITETFKGLLASAGDILTALAAGDCKPLFAALTGLKDMLTKMAGDAWDAITNFFKPVGDFFTNIWQSFGAPLVDWLSETAGDVWQFIKDLGAEIWGWTQPVRDTLGAAWDWVKKQLGIGESEAGAESAESEGGLVDWVMTKASEAWGSIKEQLQPVIGPMQTVVEKVKAILPLDAILNLRETVQGWLGKVGSMAEQMDKANGVADEQVSLREEILPGVLKTVQSLRDGMLGAGQWIAEKIGMLVVSVTGFMESLSSNPIVSAARGALEWLQDKVNQIATWAQSTIQRLFTFVGDALVYLSTFVKPVLDTLERVAAVIGDIAGRLPDLILGPLWRLIPACIREPIQDFLINVILKNIPVFGELISQLPDMWKKIQSTAMRILKQVFVDGNLLGAAWTYFSTLLEVFGLPPQLVTGILSNAAKALGDILRNPFGFLINLVKAMKEGFARFFGNILHHLLSGVTGWLFGAVKSAGINPPADLSFKSVLSFVFDVLGFTIENILTRLEKKIGPEKMATLRKAIDKATGVWEWVKLLIEGGPAAVWEKLKEQMSGLWTTVITGISAWISTKVMTKASLWLASLLDVSGITPTILGCIAIYKAIQSFMQYLREMLEIVNTVLSGIVDIAKGTIGKAAEFLEKALVLSLPVAIGFLANQVGLGDIGRRIKSMLDTVRKKVDAAIDWLIEKAIKGGQAFLNLLKRGVGAIKKGVVKFLQWWKIKKSFTTKDGQSHKIYFKDKNSGQLLVASEVTKLETIIEQLPPDKKEIVKKKYADVLDLSKNRGATEEADNNDVVKAIQGALQEIVEDIKGILSPEDPPLSNVTYQTGDEGKASKVFGEPLTKISGNTKGQASTAAGTSDSPPGWVFIAGPVHMSFLKEKQEFERAVLKKQESEIVKTANSHSRTHLLSERLHGPATRWNLTPTPNRFNSPGGMLPMEDAVRTYITTPVQEPVKRFPILRFKAEVDYYSENDLINDDQPDSKKSNYPESIIISLEEKDPTTGEYSKDTLKDPAKSYKDYSVGPIPLPIAIALQKEDYWDAFKSSVELQNQKNKYLTWSGLYDAVALHRVKSSTTEEIGNYLEQQARAYHQEHFIPLEQSEINVIVLLHDASGPINAAEIASQIVGGATALKNLEGKALVSFSATSSRYFVTRAGRMASRLLRDLPGQALNEAEISEIFKSPRSRLHEDYKGNVEAFATGSGWLNRAPEISLTQEGQEAAIFLGG